MDPNNGKSFEIENEGDEQDHQIEEEEPEGSQNQGIEEEEGIDQAYQGNGNVAEGALAFEAEFRMTHDADLARKLIEIYRDADDVANLRRIREEFLDHHLLLEEDWLQWLQDEITFAKSDEEKKAILKLFDRALEETLYFDVAKLASKYVKGLFTNGVVRKNGVNLTLNKLINHFCFDFNRGSKFFKRLRKFELEYNDNPNEQEKAKVIRNLYERQLKLPLVDIDLTLDEYLKWEPNADEKKKILTAYNETYKELPLHLDIEDRFTASLESGEIDQIKESLAQILSNENIKLEKKLNILERSLESDPNSSDIWEIYVDFADANIQINSTLEKIYKRALKTISSNISFAIKYLRVLEKTNAEPEELQKKVLGMLWNYTETSHYYVLRLQLCEIYVRRLNAKLVEVKGDLTKAKEETIRFRQSVQEAIEFFSSEQSEENQACIGNFLLFKSHIETYTLKDKQQMNQSMEKYVKQNGSEFQAWKHYITFEQALGKPGSVKQLVKRGCEYTKDDVLGMYAFAIDYDRKFGSLEELETTERKYKEKLAKQIQEAEVLAEAVVDHSIPSINVKHKVKEQKQKPQQVKEKGNKRPPKPEKNENEEAAAPIMKKTKQNRLDIGEGTGALSLKAKMEEEKEEKHEAVDPTAYPDYLDNRNTVFVKNFPKSFEAEDLKAVFGNVDKITGCRIVKDKFENSKGIAYVDFINSEEAQFACNSNGIDIDGQKLFIALSDPPKKGKEDKATIFMNNLPFEITKEEIQDSFKDLRNQINEVRIPLKPDGRAVGYAYIKFGSEDAANRALEQHKDLTIKGRKIKIEHADSSKKHDQTLKALNVALLKGLSFKATEQDIQHFFRDYSVKQIKLAIDEKTGRPKGFCFVEFNNKEDMHKVLEIANPEILGRKFTIVRSERPITESEKSQKKVTSLSRKDAEDQDGDKTPPRETPIPVTVTKPKPKENVANKPMKSQNDFRAMLFK